MFPGCHRSLFSSQSPPGHFCFLYPLPLVGPPVWHHLFPSPLCHSSISLSQAPSGLSSVQKGTLRQERLQKHLPASLSPSLCPALSPHTLPLPQPASPSPDICPPPAAPTCTSFFSVSPMSRGHCCSTRGSSLLGPRAHSQILLGPCEGPGLCQVFREEQTCLTGLRPTQPGLPPLQGEAGTPGTTIDPHASPLSRVGPEVTVLKIKGEQ